MLESIKSAWKTTSGKILLSIAALVAFCFGCLMITSIFSPKPAPLPQADVQGTAEANAWLSVTQTQAALVTDTPVFTATPAFTSTPENTPTIASTPTATANPLFAPKGNGFYLVNIDIAPGVWRSTGTSDGCYWATTTSTGNITANHFGMSGGTAYIPADGFQVEFSNCGYWEYLSGP